MILSAHAFVEIDREKSSIKKQNQNGKKQYGEMGWSGIQKQQQRFVLVFVPVCMYCVAFDTTPEFHTPANGDFNSDAPSICTVSKEKTRNCQHWITDMRIS